MTKLLKHKQLATLREVPSYKQTIMVDGKEFNAFQIAREYFHEDDVPDSELGWIIEEQSGFPCFWRIGIDGENPEQCFRRQMLRALARREIDFANFEIIQQDPYAGTVDKVRFLPNPYGRCEMELPDGTELNVSAKGEATVKLPNKAMLQITEQGQVKVDDSQEVVVYEANPRREFNRFMNVSDVLEEFVDFLGGHNVKQTDLMNMPMEMFMKWLVIQAAEQDGDDVPDDIDLNTHLQKFIEDQNGKD